MARILICTASRHEGLALQQALRSQGHCPVVEPSTLLATRYALDGSFDLVLLDTTESYFAALSACRRLRSSYRTRSLPIMILVGRSQLLTEDRQVVSRFLEAGASDYAPKPLQVASLIAQCEDLLCLTPSVDWARESILFI